jgi:hypothetical protein
MEDTKEQHIIGEDEEWDEYSKKYERFVENITVQSSMMLYSLSSARDAKTI